MRTTTNCVVLRPKLHNDVGKRLIISMVKVVMEGIKIKTFLSESC